MKAIVSRRNLPVSDPHCFELMELPTPALAARDLLVRVHAVSVNPIDYKTRSVPLTESQPPRILGFDAAGVVEQVGSACSLFRVGDRVFYAGDMTRPGANSELHAVDERLVGKMPDKISFAEAAALPLTTLTAWEALFERMGIDPGGADRGKSLLIINGAGGVGSIGIQLAKLAGLQVTASASRAETIAWCKTMGADQVINHRHPLAPQLQQLGHAEVNFIFNCHDTDQYWADTAALIKPLGKICALVSSRQPQNVELLKKKSATFAWEFMATRAMFQTPDMAVQGQILNRLAELLAAGRLRSTLTKTLAPLEPNILREAHALLENGGMIGKLVICQE